MFDPNGYRWQNRWVGLWFKIGEFYSLVDPKHIYALNNRLWLILQTPIYIGNPLIPMTTKAVETNKITTNE